MAEARADTRTEAGVAEPTLTTHEFQQLLQKEFRPQTDAAKSAIQQSVQTLAEQALANTTLVSTEVVGSIEAMIAEIDKWLSEQMNNILHHPGFQQLEGAWRGLHYLVNNTETDEFLKSSVQHHQEGAAQEPQALQGRGCPTFSPSVGSRTT